MKADVEAEFAVFNGTLTHVSAADGFVDSRWGRGDSTKVVAVTAGGVAELRAICSRSVAKDIVLKF